jgi:hypothetical protein
MQNSFFAIVLCFSLYANSAPIRCEEALHSFSIAEMLAAKKNPVDEARLLRESNHRISNAILDEVEFRLKDEKVVAFEELGGGVNESYLLTFKSGLKAVYKPVNPQRPNQIIREATAYRLSRLWELDLCPPTVYRTLDGSIPANFQNVEGSVQLFMDTAKSLKKGLSPNGTKILLKSKIPFEPDQYLSGRRLRLFDWLIKNHDRGSNAGNYMVSRLDGYIYGIDHSVTFVGMERIPREDKVPYYTLEGLNDLEFYKKINSASVEQIRQTLKELNPTRIDEFLARWRQLNQDFERYFTVGIP